jgi:hypothetical protein
VLRVVLVIACLTLGFLTTWAVATVGVRADLSSVAPSPSATTCELDEYKRGWLADDFSFAQSKDLGNCLGWMPHRQWRLDAEGLVKGSGGIGGFRAVGFPLRCFTFYSFWPLNSFPRDSEWGVRFTRLPFTETYVDLPVRPIWPTLLLDTAFFALAWSLPLGGVKLGINSLLRRRRARRGQCPWCAFSRTGLPLNIPCPECGRPAPKRNSFVGEPFPVP